MELGRRYQKYVLIGVVFSVFAFYNFAVVREAQPEASQARSEKADERIVWDVTSEAPEKIYEGILQSRAGDWYRLGIFTRASREARIEVRLNSFFDDAVVVGAFDAPQGDVPQYREIIFSIPAGESFSDIALRLVPETKGEAWPFVGVEFGEPLLSRLNVNNRAEALRLAPTHTGTIERKVQRFPAIDNKEKSKNTVWKTRFIAEGDFVESVRLNTREQGSGKTYLMELYAVGAGEGDQSVSLIRKSTLKREAFTTAKDEWGNQSFAFPARLERGREYVLSLTGKENASGKLTLLPLGGSDREIADGNNVVTVVSGRYSDVEGGTIISGARVEDFGGGKAVYSYMTTGEELDYFSLFATEGEVEFDSKKKRVAGAQKQRTSFTYRFFTVYPFERFLLSAKQAGDDEKEVKLEYSFDNVFWQEVPFTQIEKESQVFSLLLSGTGTERTVYVRASYNGEDKKSGSFGLDRLSVRAQLKRQ